VSMPLERRHMYVPPTVRLKPDTTIDQKPDATIDHLLFPPVIPSCTATPINPSTNHAIGAHRSPGVDWGYRIHTSVGDESRVMPLADNAFISPTIIVHAPPNAVPTMIT